MLTLAPWKTIYFGRPPMFCCFSGDSPSVSV